MLGLSHTTCQIGDSTCNFGSQFFFKLLRCNRESHEHLKYFRDVFCVVTNHSKDENTLISQKTSN